MAYHEGDRQACKVLLQLWSRGAVPHKGQPCVWRQVQQQVLQDEQVLLCGANTYQLAPLAVRCCGLMSASTTFNCASLLALLSTPGNRWMSANSTCAKAANVGEDDIIWVTAAHAFTHGAATE